MAKGRIYQAFCEAGLEREARTLSTTIEGKVVPALGHYISAADNILDLEKQFHKRVALNDEKRMTFYGECVNKILEYVHTHKFIAPNPEGLRVCQEYIVIPKIASLLDSLNKIFRFKGDTDQK